MTTYTIHSRLTAAVEAGLGLTLTADETLALRQEGDALLLIVDNAEHALERISALEQKSAKLEQEVRAWKAELYRHSLIARGISPYSGEAIVDPKVN